MIGLKNNLKLQKHLEFVRKGGKYLENAEISRIAFAMKYKLEFGILYIWNYDLSGRSTFFNNEGIAQFAIGKPFSWGDCDDFIIPKNIAEDRGYLAEEAKIFFETYFNNWLSEKLLKGEL